MSAFVFLSYVRENSAIVDRLRDDLTAQGISVWLDRQSLQPGEEWQVRIGKAISQSRFFIACFSAESVQRQKTEMHTELLLAIEEMKRHPPERVWFLPVKLSPCEVPEHVVTGSKTLRSYQTQELYPDWQTGLQRLVAVLREERSAASTMCGTAPEAAFPAGAVVPALLTTNVPPPAAPVTPPSVLNEQHVKIEDLTVEGEMFFANDSHTEDNALAGQVKNQMSVEIGIAKVKEFRVINNDRRR